MWKKKHEKKSWDGFKRLKMTFWLIAILEHGIDRLEACEWKLLRQFLKIKNLHEFVLRQTMKNSTACAENMSQFSFRFVLMFNDVLKLTLQLIQNTKFTFYWLNTKNKSQHQHNGLEQQKTWRREWLSLSLCWEGRKWGNDVGILNLADLRDLFRSWIFFAVVKSQSARKTLINVSFDFSYLIVFFLNLAQNY